MVVQSRIIDDRLVEHEDLSFTSILPLVTSNNVSELKRLSRGFESNFLNSILDEAGHNLLHIACMYGHLDCAFLLIQKGINLNQADSFNGDTPLHRAIQGGHLDVAALLLKSGASPNVLDQMGNSPLHEAMEQGNLKAVQLLLSFGVNVNIRNEDGMTPLHIGAENDKRRCYATLLCHGADDSVLSGEDNEEDEVEGESARDAAIDIWGTEWYEEVEKVLRMQKELSDCGPLLSCLLTERGRVSCDSVILEFLLEVEDQQHILAQSVLPFVYEFHSSYV